jgi:Protein of unknown function (DUF4089)
VSSNDLKFLEICKYEHSNHGHKNMGIAIEDKVALEAYAKAVAQLQGIPISADRLPAVVMYLQLAGRMAATLDNVELGLDEELAALYRVTP